MTIIEPTTELSAPGAVHDGVVALGIQNALQHFGKPLVEDRDGE